MYHEYYKSRMFPISKLGSQMAKLFYIGLRNKESHFLINFNIKRLLRSLWQQDKTVQKSFSIVYLATIKECFVCLAKIGLTTIGFGKNETVLFLHSLNASKQPQFDFFCDFFSSSYTVIDSQRGINKELTTYIFCFMCELNWRNKKT